MIGERVARVLDEALSAQGLNETDLGAEDVAYAEGVVRTMVIRLSSRRSWDAAVGERLTHAQVLALTEWSKQALSKAVHDHRVLRVVSDSGSVRYPLCGFDEASPARPLTGLAAVLQAWAGVDPRGWATVSWLRTPQPELGGRTPVEALASGGPDAALVAVVARQAAARLAA